VVTPLKGWGSSIAGCSKGSSTLATAVTRLLVVEDEESFSDPLSYVLRREGYDVDVAATGPEALARFDRNGRTWCCWT